MFLSHNVLSVSFNTLEYAAALVAYEGTMCVNSIQLFKIVVASYLVGSHKTMIDTYWSLQLNKNPQLLKLDVKVIIQKIIISPNELWNLKTDDRATHVLCSTKDKDKLNSKMCRHQSSHLLQGSHFCSFPLRMKN